MKYAHFFLFLIVLLSCSSALAETSYTISEDATLGLKKLFSKFKTLEKSNDSEGHEPQLGKVEADVGCSVEVFPTGRRYQGSYPVFVNGQMHIDGKKLKLREISELYPTTFQKLPNARHTFYMAGSYLVDIVSASKGKELDSGTEEYVFVKVRSSQGTTVVVGSMYCGC